MPLVEFHRGHETCAKTTRSGSYDSQRVVLPPDFYDYMTPAGLWIDLDPHAPSPSIKPGGGDTPTKARHPFHPPDLATVHTERRSTRTVEDEAPTLSTDAATPSSITNPDVASQQPPRNDGQRSVRSVQQQPQQPP